MVKNPPSSAGDMGSILGLGTKIPCAGRQLSLHMPQLLSPLGLQLRPDAAKKKKKPMELEIA